MYVGRFFATVATPPICLNKRARELSVATEKRREMPQTDPYTESEFTGSHFRGKEYPGSLNIPGPTSVKDAPTEHETLSGTKVITPPEPVVKKTIPEKSVKTTVAPVESAGKESVQIESKENGKKQVESDKNEEATGKEPAIDAETSKVDQEESDDNADFHSPREDAKSGHFFVYLVCTAVLVAVLYISYHNKRKIIAYCVEGKRSRSARRPKTTEYMKVEQNL
ncbi:trans-Golgi network integral membrane protein 1 isoform X1 [Esox lucius]|uniref:Trans-golgi network protein 2 n=1 Tax=Esox lucius TaxID=8010 RepID=A0AAY5K1V3_ESOLU|nr:trans-Golgi network integral membrane protein 1 isoform X1 [Esox lucius]XP_019908345.2 trans-Golgi network integral membrane protein 1 isoform X1 [Esox lucius]